MADGLTNPLEMSDEEFLKLPPDAMDSLGSSGSPEGAPSNQDEDAQPDADQVADPAPVTSGDPAVEERAGDASSAQDTLQDTTAAESTVTEPASPENPDKKPAGETDPASAPDYEGFYKQIMTPFKANGKTIELRTPEEAVQLMQMGANYTRKMQELAPHRKVLMMLQNNGLLDENKLSFLIDVEKKNPDAIKKLVKDSGIDPMDIDVSTEPTYSGGHHLVSDDAVAFTTVLEDVKSTQGGVETLQVINGQWDQASKEVLWTQPELIQVIHEQRENGIYSAITAEMDRRKTLGLIPANTPFLAAYKTLGDELNAKGAFAQLGKSSQASQPAQPVTTRVQQPKPAVANGDRVAAASPTRATPQKANQVLNPLAMSDEDFLKMTPRM